MLEMYSIREKGSNNNYLQLFICIKMVKNFTFYGIKQRLFLLQNDKFLLALCT